jgi:outer membrane protein OmpA-like peptidoglycan-associated protein
MKKYSIILLLLFVLKISSAQTNLEMANDAFAAKEYTTALSYYQKVLKNPGKKDDLGDIRFKVAESYRYNGKLDEAVEWYDKAKGSGYSNPNYLFHQGSIYLKQGKYELAKQKFEAFLELQPGDKEAILQLNNTKFIMNLPKDSSVYTFKNEAGLNTPYGDYAALALKNSVVFTSSRLEEKDEKVYSYDGQAFSDLYQSTYSKENKSWSKAQKATALNTAINEGFLCYCEKTKTAYFDRGNDGKTKSNLYKIYEVSYDESNATFGTPKAISLGFVQKADMKQPAISADGNTLFFASNMEGGAGNYDIWITKKSGDSWGEPVNAGTVINTEFNDAFPVVHDSALIYSTEGLPGYGALDLFSTVYTNGTFSKPQNLKAPFNSSGDDFFMALNADGKSGYLSSNRAGGQGNDDVYSFFLTPVNLIVKGRILDVDNNQPVVGATVVLTASDGTTDTTTTNANGDYSFTLNADKDYKINVLNPGYFGDSKKLTTQGEKFSKEFSKSTGHNYDFAIKKIPKTEIKIDNIYYDLDSFVLREESKPSLDKLVKILEDTPDADVQINSHTDERGKVEYNTTLSQNRAKSVVDYLVSKGINPARLTAKGFGFSQPVIKGAKTEEEHQQNRRTAFQVIQK